MKNLNQKYFLKFIFCSEKSYVNDFLDFLTRKNWKFFKLQNEFPKHFVDLLVVSKDTSINLELILEKYDKQLTRVLFLDHKPSFDILEDSSLQGLIDWWGWENIYQDLVHEIPDTKEIEIKNVITGHNWSYVETNKGAGLSRTPSRDTHGARSIENAGSLLTLSLRQLSSKLLIDDDLERSIGIAAVNSYFNLSESFEQLQPEQWGFRIFRGVQGNKCCIGRFPPALEILPDIKIVEKQPKEGDFSEDEADNLLPNADYVMITSQTLMNGTLPRLLFLSQNAKVMLLGPTTPLSKVFEKYGVHYLCGATVINQEAMRNFISQAGAMLMLDHQARKIRMVFE